VSGSTVKLSPFARLTVNGPSSTSFDGAITGPLASLVKSGSGSLQLSGASTYSGATTVNGGKLLVTGSLNATSSVAVNAGTLGGTGNINPAAPVAVALGGEIAPGINIGTLSTGPVTFAAGAILTVEIDAASSDKLTIAGAGNLSGLVSLGLTLVADPADNTTFTIVDGTSPLVGYGTGGRLTFGANSLDEGEVFTVTSGLFTQNFQISYLADAGNDVTLLAVPEPAGATLLLLGATAMAARRRRRS
jgi:autotransporter-associated beta strand protein